MPSTGDVADLAWVRAALATGEAQAIRQRAGVTPKEVGDVLGVDQSTVWRWEARQRQPRTAVGLRYAALLRQLAAAAADRPMRAVREAV
jgi:DNA-binding transcriptional regulator YiaG